MLLVSLNESRSALFQRQLALGMNKQLLLFQLSGALQNPKPCSEESPFRGFGLSNSNHRGGWCVLCTQALAEILSAATAALAAEGGGNASIPLGSAAETARGILLQVRLTCPTAAAASAAVACLMRP